ncbi:MAG: glycosyltransferase family 4 protein [Candidatus Hermodarchaeota archaeon]
MVVESHVKEAGGGPMYWAQLSEGLIQRGHEVVILSGTPKEGEFASPNTVGLLPVRSNLRSRSLSTLLSRYVFRRRFVPGVRAFARDWRPDVIHTAPPIASEAALHVGSELGVPVIASVLSHVEEQWTQLESGPVRSRLFRYLESRGHRRSFSRIICLTRRSEQILVSEGVPAERIVYVPHAVDVTRFHSKGEARFRHQLKLSADAFIVGYAGALTRDKGFDQLLEAMTRLKSAENVHLLVAGGAFSQRKWEEFVKEAELHHVHFLGPLDHQDMPGFMASLDLYVIPSLAETLPTTLLEALAVGTPVLATGVGGVTEFLQSQWGIILDSPEAECIAQALDEWQVRRSELEQMGKLGRQYVKDHHNWERTSELTEGVYQACLENQ